MSKIYHITGFADEIAQDLITQVESVKTLGVDHIEVRGVNGNNMIFHDHDSAAEIKRYLDDNGIGVSALGSPLGKISILDPFEPHMDAFKHAVEIAHIMGTPNIRMFSFYIPEGESPSAYEEAVFERISGFIEYAKANDIVLLHENEKGIYGEKADCCKKLMDTFYGDHFKAIFDFANFVQADQDTMEAYTMLKPYIAYIHVKDALKGSGNVVPAGFGDGQLFPILNDLYKNGYNGFLSLEPHLFNFSGLASLETANNRTKIENKTHLTGFEAFSLAHESLLKLLERID